MGPTPHPPACLHVISSIGPHSILLLDSYLPIHRQRCHLLLLLSGPGVQPRNESGGGALEGVHQGLRRRHSHGMPHAASPPLHRPATHHPPTKKSESAPSSTPHMSALTSHFQAIDEKLRDISSFHRIFPPLKFQKVSPRPRPPLVTPSSPLWSQSLISGVWVLHG